MDHEAPKDAGTTSDAGMTWSDAEALLQHKRHFLVLGTIKAGRAIAHVIPPVIRRTAYDVLVSVSPDVPTDLQRLTGVPNGWRVFLYAFVAGVVLCFGVTSTLTLATGTWSGIDPRTVYFSEDWQNMVLYLLVCPAYIGWSVWLVTIFIGRSATLATFADEVGAAKPTVRFPRFPLTVVGMVLIAAFVVFAYISDILDSRHVPEAYWFMTAPSATGERFLNRVGVYYVVLNFCLMFLTAAATFCFFSMFFDTLRAGHGLRTLPRGTPIDFRMVATRLTTFTEAYLIAKLLCATYIVNVVVWRLSPLGATSNVHAASLALAAMGLFFISFPRYYVELMWREYQLRTGATVDSFKDLRTARERVVVSVVDTLFVSTFVFNSLSLYLPISDSRFWSFAIDLLESILGS